MVTVETEETPAMAPVLLTMGVAAELLVQDGKKQAAALLLDVRRIWIRPYNDQSISVPLYVDFWAVERFSDQLREEIEDAQRLLPEPRADWYEHVEALLSGPDVTNQGALRVLSPTHPVVDGLHFRSEAEVAVYRALKARDGSQPATERLYHRPQCRTTRR